MARNTENKIIRKRSFEEKKTGKIMPPLFAMTEQLTTELSEALQEIHITDFDSVQDFVAARRDVIEQFRMTKKEMMEAVEEFYTN